MATILVIDESDTHRAEVRAAIEGARAFRRILEAREGLGGLRLLLNERVDVVLCNLELPGLNGEKLLRVKGQSPGGANIPFIVLTGNRDLGRRAQLLEDGASDVIGKPFHAGELVARLGLHLKVKRLQDELMVKNATLERLSTVDALTGLRTRRYAIEVLHVEFLRARRYQTQFALFMADLDHFKAVNDSYGHPAGDAVLRGVAQALLSGTRATDVVARYGGEELLAILPQNTLKGARIAAEHWREKVEKQPFEIPDGRQVQVTVSVGVAEFHRGSADPDELIAAADRALYLAKEKGRNRVEVEG